MELHRISEIIEDNPSLKASKATEAEHIREQWEEEQHQYKKARARAYLEIKAKYPKDSIATLNAKVDDDFTLYEHYLKVLKLETIYRRIDIEVTKLDDEFTGAKKFINLKTREMNL